MLFGSRSGCLGAVRMVLVGVGSFQELFELFCELCESFGESFNLFGFVGSLSRVFLLLHRAITRTKLV